MNPKLPIRGSLYGVVNHKAKYHGYGKEKI